MIRWIRNYLNQRVDPAPNPLRLTLRAVDEELAGLRGRDSSVRDRADRLLDVRSVLALYETTDQTWPSATRRSSFAYPSLTPTSMPL
ncbi:hypothetical protein [Actinoplanes derwentensis]|uniref:hypothetical protein n=1 Tax=Actinoplanes derwentensis TaxID=113562 RepID=UPI0012FDEE24|nr:hypothetical protein [Actinoplanes derwentensis]GID84389.1 hypothetical protein Ade03nite_33130 [Actinoplanes derwentensis]